MRHLRRHVWFYIFHGVVLLAVCFAYLFHFRPQDLDKTTVVSALVLILWSIYNSPILPKLAGQGVVSSYRIACIRHFNVFSKVSVVLLAGAILWGGVMLRELWSRWTYVDLVKRMTFDESLESVPLASVEDLAKAFNLYPHRREIVFVVARMSRLLAFDDETSNYNVFAKAFLSRVDRDKVVKVYSDKSRLASFEGSNDPIIFLTRLIVDADFNATSLREALGLLMKHRQGDELAQLHRLILEHELASLPPQPDPSEIEQLRSIRTQMRQLLDGVKGQTSTGTYMRLVTSHAFQEILDHYVSAHVQLADLSRPAGEVNTIVGLCARILTTRKQIANASEVPWLDGPGRLALYQFFKHRVGRESDITSKMLKFYGRVPGLVEALDTKIIAAEAYKDYRSLETWDKGTPLNGAFSGSGMNSKLTQWLKAGW
jgi:hypothetical protein